MSPTPDALGAWLIACAAVMSMIFLALGIAVNIRTLRTRERKKPLIARFVARKEMEELRSELKALDNYTHESVHGIRDGLNATRIKIEALHLQMVKEIQEAMTPLAAAIAEVSKSLAVLRAHQVAGDGKQAGVAS